MIASQYFLLTGQFCRQKKIGLKISLDKQNEIAERLSSTDHSFDFSDISNEITLIKMVEKYGLPVSVTLPYYFGNFYYVAESIDKKSNKIWGTQYKNGEVYKIKGYSFHEICSKYEDEDEENTFIEDSSSEDREYNNSIKNRIKAHDPIDIEESRIVINYLPVSSILWTESEGILCDYIESIYESTGDKEGSCKTSIVATCVRTKKAGKRNTSPKEKGLLNFSNIHPEILAAFSEALVEIVILNTEKNRTAKQYELQKTTEKCRDLIYTCMEASDRDEHDIYHFEISGFLRNIGILTGEIGKLKNSQKKKYFKFLEKLLEERSKAENPIQLVLAVVDALKSTGCYDQDPVSGKLYCVFEPSKDADKNKLTVSYASYEDYSDAVPDEMIGVKRRGDVFAPYSGGGMSSK